MPENPQSLWNGPRHASSCSRYAKSYAKRHASCVQPTLAKAAMRGSSPWLMISSPILSKPSRPRVSPENSPDAATRTITTRKLTTIPKTLESSASSSSPGVELLLPSSWPIAPRGPASASASTAHWVNLAHPRLQWSCEDDELFSSLFPLRRGLEPARPCCFSCGASMRGGDVTTAESKQQERPGGCIIEGVAGCFLLSCTRGKYPTVAAQHSSGSATRARCARTKGTPH